MGNNYEQILKQYPQRLAKQIENSDDFQQALVFASEKVKKENDPSIKGLKISCVEITISFSLQANVPTASDFSIHIPKESYN
ncbi:MAG: hypothetical protein ACI30H_00190 [Paludibacteraceae bacterium]